MNERLDANPVFGEGARVTIVQMISDRRFFGVAMRGGRYVVQLPLGYDGLTSVRWINGFIVVKHPDPKLPALLADTTTGTHKELDPLQFEQLLADVRSQAKLARNAKILH